ncbi:PRP18 Pre-mRNA processing factor-like protein, putative (macronuclear) [Tetrahymena thermophila SB210]|uniref:Pre-mRNA-splicing factor 18 n=1 Tax=Tetrahymena thermophila (strain SB210) TaxID=312017 RepID=Q22HI6_TETTS|nr:PRP18 Pre-mRNA processing factor-like protein, putative [Tetrahymena thermophila SB210]EAR84715.2 PRP18 Pre-mRNA processing factor-like protein, putative [Tetrahymena thermophila SB210]|eukprot:XP_001032378.2 PRP18 Pre-mRNA processing factor-like protein, putative [Tetrahymena thermophila SB210]
MDSLKNILAKKKETVQKQGQVVKKADLEKEREENYWKQQAEIQKQEELRKQQYLEDLQKYQANPYKKLKKDEKKDEGQQNENKEEEQPPIPKAEVIKKLRQFGVPVTFFGETDQQRYKRLKKLELDATENKNQGGNVYDKILKMNEEDFKKKQREEADYIDEEKIQKLFARLNQPEQNISTEKVTNKKQQELEIEKLKQVSNDTKNEDILIWSQKTLRDWEQKLEQRFTTDEQKKSVLARKLIGNFRQTSEYLKPLFKLLKEKKCSQDILDGLYIVVNYALQREYVKANDKYLALAIGNAAWPMGVTMVGIHERAGRSKIFSSQVAHILNDETTRKYLQSMKRLVTVQQLMYPSEDKAKMINYDTTMEELF